MILREVMLTMADYKSIMTHAPKREGNLGDGRGCLDLELAVKPFTALRRQH